MSGRTRVLVVDDSATIRDRLCDVLQSAPGFEVVGSADNGEMAVELCRQLQPDVVTMDMMMPGLDGLAATERIMASCPTPILVVSASFNRAEVFHTYDALAAGAVDVLDKPTGDEAPGEWERRFLSAVRVVSRIQVITHHRGRRRSLARGATPADAHRPAPREMAVIAIGASTGGPAAVVELFRHLPVAIGVPVLLVIHLNPQFGHAFADWLDAQSPWRARFARDGEALASSIGTIMLAPPGLHTRVEAGRVRLDDGPERFSCKPSVDVLFESVALEFGADVAAALLTGMGRDGAAGLLAIRRAGGETIAQDEATSVVYGMPREAAVIGAAQRILPLPEIAPALGRLALAKTPTR